MQVVQQIDSFIPQGLSNMVWATAHLRNGTRGCVGPHSGGNPPTGVPRELRPGWQPSPAFLAAVASTATRRMSEFQSQTLSNLLWGFCKLDVYPQQLFEAAAAELVERCGPARYPSPPCQRDARAQGAPPSPWRRFRTPELARQFRAQELSNSIYVGVSLLHGCRGGFLGWRPGTSCELCTRPHAHPACCCAPHPLPTCRPLRKATLSTSGC
jgi:hypothetical protein